MEIFQEQMRVLLKKQWWAHEYQLNHDVWCNKAGRVRTLQDMSGEEVTALEKQYGCKVLLNPPPRVEKKKKRLKAALCTICGKAFPIKFGWSTTTCGGKCRYKAGLKIKEARNEKRRDKSYYAQHTKSA